MHSSIIDLFQYTRSRVTDQDIIDFSPGDPGYPNYVKLWTEIRKSGLIPQRANFNLSEVIGLTCWAAPKDWNDPLRFLNYRRFTVAVGIALLHYGNDSESVHPANYLACKLILDLDPSSDRYLALLRAVLSPTRDILCSTNLDEGYPFFTFASMILAQKAQDWNCAEDFASQLILDENSVRNNKALSWIIKDDRFLLGLSNYNQLHKHWLSFATELKNPNDHEDTQLIIDSITNKK